MTDSTTESTTESTAGFRVRAGLRLLVRLVLPAATLIALAVGAAPAVTGGLALAGLALAAERLVALRRSGLADRVLVGVGGVLVTLILAGIGMDLLGVVLRPASWTVAVAVLAVAGLLVGAVLPARDAAFESPVDRVTLSTAVRVLPWVAVAAVVAVVAVHVSATSLYRADEPPLQMSFGRVSGSQVQVVLRATDPVGPLEVRTAAGGDEISYPLFSLTGDDARTTTVTLPLTGRYVISLNYPDQTEPLRTLVLDR